MSSVLVFSITVLTITPDNLEKKKICHHYTEFSNLRLLQSLKKEVLYLNGLLHIQIKVMVLRFEM